VSGRPRLQALPGGAENEHPRPWPLPGRNRLRALPGGAEGGDQPASGTAWTEPWPAGRPLHAVTASGRRGLVAGALAAAGSFLIEPAVPPPESVPPSPPGLRPVVAVFGLARGCGVTVVSRALAVELAGRNPEGAAAVHCEVRGAGIPLATQAAARLARALADVPGADTRAVGRLCLVAGADRDALADTARYLAPLVLDAGSAALGGAPAALADRVIVVATAATEPALASVAVDCLARLGHEPIVVLNRVREACADPVASADPAGSADAAARSSVGHFPVADDRSSGWASRAVHRLPDSRLGAQLALGGREARGELGRAIARLADMCGEA
jgi:hypothetical protein